MIFVRSKRSQKFVGSCVVFTSAAVILKSPVLRADQGDENNNKFVIVSKAKLWERNLG
jgi:hypothetical protein